MSGPLEKAYDEHIAPLMSQIIALCKEHHINMCASFQLDHNEEQGCAMHCTTLLQGKDADSRIRNMGNAAYPSRSSVLAMTVFRTKETSDV